MYLHQILYWDPIRRGWHACENKSSEISYQENVTIRNVENKASLENGRKLTIPKEDLFAENLIEKCQWEKNSKNKEVFNFILNAYIKKT